MFSPVPLFPGLPGGIEILVVLLVFVVPLSLLAVVAVLGVGLVRRRSSNDAEVERLERRVEELERQQGASRADDRVRGGDERDGN